MKNKFLKSIIAGLVATAVMTIVGMLAPYLGLPKINPAQMLSGMLSVPVALGFVMHFIIGLIFAATYVYWFNQRVSIHSKLLKGALFGIAVFVFAQIMLFVMSQIMPMPEGGEETNMMLMMLASLIGHIVYGIFVALLVPGRESAPNTGEKMQTATA